MLWQLPVGTYVSLAFLLPSPCTLAVQTAPLLLQVVFTGEVGPDEGTVIALDDLTLTQENCQWGSSAQCEFVNGTSCYWTNSNTGLQWFVSDGSSQHTFNGPPSDSDMTGTLEYI